MPAPMNKISPHRKFYSDGVAGEGQEDGSTGLKVLADKFDHLPLPLQEKRRKSVSGSHIIITTVYLDWICNLYLL